MAKRRYLTNEYLTPPILCKVNFDAECDLIHAGEDGARESNLSFAQRIDLFAEHYASDTKIPSLVSPACSKCEFYTKERDEQSGLLSGRKECWKSSLGWKEEDFESPTVLDVWNFRKKDKLISSGCIKMADITEVDVMPHTDNKPGVSASERQWFQILKYQSSDTSVWMDVDK